MSYGVARWEKLYRTRTGKPWAISELAGDDGEMFLCIETPDEKPDRLIMREWATSNYENVLEMLKLAIKPVTTTNWRGFHETGSEREHQGEAGR